MASRFELLVRKLRRRGIRNPRALAAFIGRKKFGKKRFQEMALAGRRAALRKRASHR